MPRAEIGAPGSIRTSTARILSAVPPTVGLRGPMAPLPSWHPKRNQKWRSREDSNVDLRLRKPGLCPLSYETGRVSSGDRLPSQGNGAGRENRTKCGISIESWRCWGFACARRARLRRAAKISDYEVADIGSFASIGSLSRSVSCDLGSGNRPELSSGGIVTISRSLIPPNERPFGKLIPARLSRAYIGFVRRTGTWARAGCSGRRRSRS